MQVELQPLINGVRHAWSSIEVNILGRIVTGITAIKYGNEREKELLYGAGSDPVAMGNGNNKPEASVSLYAYEVQGIMDATEDGDITKIAPFPIIVSYMEEGSDKLVTHTIRSAAFLKNMRDWKQGDTKQEVELSLITSGIKWK